MKTGKKKRYIFIIIIYVIFIFTVFLFKRPVEEKPMDTGKKDVSIHSCALGAFTKKVRRGESTTFEVFLEASLFWPKYRVRLGNLPKDVTGTVEDAEGRGDGKALVNINVGNNAKLANYSLIIVYEERRASGEYVPTFCQYNLIIEE